MSTADSPAPRLDPQVAHRIPASELIALVTSGRGQEYLSDLRVLLARQIQAGHVRRPCATWQDAWNDLTGAAAHRPGRLTLHGVRCPTCHGRGFDTRHISRNLARTGNPTVCGECRGSRRATVNLSTRYAALPA